MEATKLMVAVIPHTRSVTMFKELKAGVQVNLEFDIIGKYVENMVDPFLNKSEDSGLEKYVNQHI